MKNLLIVSMMLLSISVLQADERQERALKKWEEKAWNELRERALKGDADAQNSLGEAYYNGKGVSENNVEAVKWYRKAVDQGLARAQFNLGVCYYLGDGVPEDVVEAVKLFRKAAEQGDAYAQFELGAFYAKGEGVPKNMAEAVKLYRMAAIQGLASAQYTLGVCYANGSDIPKNEVEAYAYLTEAGFELKVARTLLAGLEKRMTPQQIAEGKKRFTELQKEIDANRAKNHVAP
jgi:hypothetical protein